LSDPATANNPLVVVVDSTAARAAIIQSGLEAAGYTKVKTLIDDDSLASSIEALEPDVIIIDVENPKRNQLDNMLQLTKAVKRPVAMFVETSDKEATERAIEAGVSAYVVDGFREVRIHTIMEMAITRFNAFARLERELASAKSSLSEQTTLNRAKHVLMEHKKITEQEAHQLLQRTAMNQNRRMAEVAEGLIRSASILNDTQ
jgi:two-component system, response regulator / RNA-binding antiterminator